MTEAVGVLADTHEQGYSPNLARRVPPGPPSTSCGEARARWGRGVATITRRARRESSRADDGGASGAVIWTIGELVEAATNPETVPPRHAPFTVINGGLSVQR